MDIRNEDGPPSPKWIPYDPAPQTTQERIGLAFRRYGFAAACSLFAALLGLVWVNGGGDLSDGEVQLDVVPGMGETSAATTSARARAGSTVDVLTRPRGAIVQIDSETAGATPLRRYQLPSGAHIVTIKKEGYQPVDSVVMVRQGEPVILSISLRAQADGERGGEGPARAEGPASGEAGASAARSVEAPQPQAYGSLRLATEPSGARAWLDGREVGRTPLTVSDVPAGTYTLTLEVDGYRLEQRDVTVREAAVEVVEERLNPLTGALSVVVRPWGSIYIDDRLYQEDTDVRYMTVLPVGRHKLTVVHPELGTWERTVNLTLDETTSVIVDFNNPGDALVDRKPRLTW